MSKYYAVYYEPGESWVANKSIGEQNLGSHVEYLTDLHERGVVKMGGPFADGQAGLVIAAADGVAAVNKIIENDPAVLSGILAAHAREWTPVV